MSLFDRATKIGKLPLTSKSLYWWISNSAALFLKPADNQTEFRLYHLDINTGRETALDAFNAKHGDRINGTLWHVSTVGVPGYEVVYSPPECSLSPDGRWFLWCSRRETWMAASLDAGMQRKWPGQHSIPSHGCWLSGGRKWAELISDYKRKNERFTIRKIIVRSVHRRVASRITEIAVPDGIVLGATHRNSILIYHPSWTQVLNASFTEISLPPARPIRRYSIQLPEPGTISEVALSMGGDQLAWILKIGNKSFPGEYVLAYSNFHGEKIEEFGRVHGQFEESEMGTGKRTYYWPQSLRWSPDGHEIGFVFKDDLYRLGLS